MSRLDLYLWREEEMTESCCIEKCDSSADWVSYNGSWYDYFYFCSDHMEEHQVPGDVVMERKKWENCQCEN